ncbi:gas vesicle protein GvpG [Streptomyces sp. NPDC002476]|uniref:gas vesicle protein GvpG n=1 Tax=Streptomyces sp. NPDC002476 TaxID=3364648 RepID=UPI0036940EA0
MIGRVVEAAENEYDDPGPVEREPAALERRLLSGETDEETSDRRGTNPWTGRTRSGPVAGANTA